MAARFDDVSELEIDQFIENAVPHKTEDATQFGVKLFKGRLIKLPFLQVTQITENWYVCLHFFASKCWQLLGTFAKYFVVQNGFNSSKSSQMK